MTTTGKQGRLLADTIGKALDAKGFRPINSAKVCSYLKAAYEKSGQPDIAHRSMPILDGECIFNRGIGCSASNVFIFVRYDDRLDSVTVLTTSPRSDLHSPYMKRSEIYTKEIFHDVQAAEVDGIAAEVAAAAHANSVAKRPNERRVQMHLHAMHDFNSGLFFDDGVSSIADVARRAMLHNTDVLVFTPHNSIDYGRFVALAGVCSILGITAVMGVELTMPLVRRHFNGPHHLLLLGAKDAAEQVGRKILSKRDVHLTMQSYWRSQDGTMLLDSMYRIIEPLRKEGKAALGAAHPFNFNGMALQIKSVGLFSAADIGQLSLNEAKARAAGLDFTEAWNRSLYPEPFAFQNPKLREWITGIVDRFIYNNDSNPLSGELRRLLPIERIMSANVCNTTLALWLAEKYKTQSSFGPDDHRTPPLDEDYRVGGDYPGAGFSYFYSDERLSAAGIVSRLAAKALGLRSYAYTVVTSNGLQIAPARAEPSPELADVVYDLKIKQGAMYARTVGSDFSYLLGSDPGMLIYLDR